MRQPIKINVFSRLSHINESAIATLPEHKGYGMVLLFNQLFKSFTEWRRKAEESPLWSDVSEEELELFDIKFQLDACCLGW